MSETENVKIAVAIHSSGPIEATVYNNHISVFAAWAKTHKIILLSLDRAKVADARNILVQAAIEQECTHIFFLDTDHIVEHDTLSCLLGNKDAAMVSGLVCRKDNARSQVAFIEKDGWYYGLELPQDGMSYEVDACAFGCTLIDLSVFKDIEEPWFRDTCCRTPEGKLHQRRSDVNFCSFVKDLGLKIRVDTRVRVGHRTHGETLYPPTKEYQLATYQKAAEVLCNNNLSSVLDLGCGFGHKLHKYLSPIAKYVDAVDREAVVDYTKQHYKDIDFSAWDLEKPFAGFGKHDLVICADVLEHLENYNVLLETIKSSMTDNGYAVLSTPDAATLSATCIINPDHKQQWSKDEFIKLLNDSNLPVEKCIYKKEFAGYMTVICICRKGK